MLLKELKIKNFLSIKDMTIRFKDSFQIIGYNKDEGGSNGSGKSAIIEALFYALYGESIRGIPIANLVNINAKHAQVSISFVKDNTVFLLERSIAPNNAQLTFDTRVIKGIKNVNTFLENILPDKKLFYLTTLFSNKTKFSNLTDRERKELVSAFVNLDIIDAIKEKVMDDKADYERKIYQAETKIANFKGRVLELKQNYKKLKERISKFDKDKVSKCKKIVKKGIPKKPPDNSMKIAYLGNKIRELENQKKHLVQKVCPYCLRPFTNQKLLDQRKNEVDTSINKLKQEIDKIQSQQKKYNDNDYNNKLKRYIKCRDIVNSYKSYKNDIKDLKSIKLRIKNLKTDYTKTKTELDYYTELKDIAMFWIKSLGFKGVKYDLIKNFLEVFANSVNQYLNKLDLPFLIIFQSVGDNFERLKVIVKTPFGNRILESFSTGEKRKIDIAFMLALNDIALQLGLGIPYLIFDEVLDGLDAFSIEKVVNLLSESNKFFIVVSHIPIKLDISTLKVIKSNGITRRL